MLASRLLRQPTRQFLSRSTRRPFPSLIAPRTRAFHASAPRNDAVLDALLYLPHEMMSVIHNTGIPWYAAIPLTAFIVRGLLVTTAGGYARALTARYIGLHPLRQAMALNQRDKLMRTEMQKYRNPHEAKRVVSDRVKAYTRALDERWNCTLWGQINWTLLQIPIFFTMAEIIRKMCGTQSGLLGMGLEATGLQTASYKIHDLEMGPVNQWFEPSLANEGMLWFPDLLVADPTGTLPFVVSALMFANVYTTKNGPADPSQIPRTTKAIRTTLLGVSLLIGPLCQHVPAALLLYWASSTSSVIVWNWWLDWKHPVLRGFMACKRELRILPSPSSRGRRV